MLIFVFQLNITSAAEAYGYTMFAKLLQVCTLLEVHLLSHKWLFFSRTLIYVIGITLSKIFLRGPEHSIMHKLCKDSIKNTLKDTAHFESIK